MTTSLASKIYLGVSFLAIQAGVLFLAGLSVKMNGTTELGCCGPLPAFGLMSGFLMVLNLKMMNQFSGVNIRAFFPKNIQPVQFLANQTLIQQEQL